MTQDELTAIRERCEKASPGPWEADSSGWFSEFGESCVIHLPNDRYAIRVSSEEELEDAEFISHARTDIPALLDHIREQEGEIERLRIKEKKWDEWCEYNKRRGMGEPPPPINHNPVG